jgi:uncharacterized protein (TIGR00730 family)
MKNICVFCGSNPGVRPAYLESARALGRLLLQRDLGLVYGGGRVGLMGEIAETVQAGGGRVVGVIPRALLVREGGDPASTNLQIVPSMHERKAIMAAMSDGFVALPGGFGTFEELCEIVTWAQLGLHAKPIGLLNVESYFDPMIAMFDRAVAEGFVAPVCRSLVLQESGPERLLDRMSAYVPPPVERWIDPDES